MELDLSVIVPAYNGEKTIKRAIDSLLCQSLSSIEIIVVDDGSKDKTGSIADDYAASDPRVTVIHKTQNEGLSAGRNTGIAASHGRYITFLDCDDWVEPKMYEVMLENSSDADIVVTGAYHDVQDAEGSVVVRTEDSIGETCVSLTPKDNILWAARLDQKRLFAYTWNKLYKRSFLCRANREFLNQTLIEDFLFNCAVWNVADSISLVDGCWYHYVKFSKEALTQRYLPDYFEIMNMRYEMIRDLFVSHGYFEGTERQILCTMHMKHIVAGMVKNCSSKSGMDGKQQRFVIAKVLRDSNCLEAMRYGKGSRIQEKVCNAVLKTKSVVLNYLFAKVLFTMQNSHGNLFDKLK